MNREPQGPETVGEAMADDRRTSAYRRAGLCARCSSHLLKGHAYGFARIPGEPCDDCAPIIATFPEPTISPSWRKWRRGRLRGRSMRPSALLGVVTCQAAAGTVMHAGKGVE